MQMLLLMTMTLLSLVQGTRTNKRPRNETPLVDCKIEMQEERNRVRDLLGLTESPTDNFVKHKYWTLDLRWEKFNKLELPDPRQRLYHCRELYHGYCILKQLAYDKKGNAAETACAESLAPQPQHIVY